MLTLAGIYAVLAMILNLEAGWAGLWDLGTAGLMAVGAYFYVITTSDASDVLFAPGWPMAVGIVGSAFFTGVVALFLGVPALRLRGEYFLITTFAFSEVIRQLLTNELSLTRGARGFHQIPRPLGDVFRGSDYKFLLLAIVALSAVAAYLLLRRVALAPIGRTLRGIRDNEAAALAVGKHTARYRTATFVFAGVLIGAFAPVYVWYIRSLTPDLFSPELTFTAWTALVVGGIGSIRGPLLGALLLIFTTQATQFLQVSPEHAVKLAGLQSVTVGLALILVLRFRPQGVIPADRDFAGPALAIDDRPRRGS